MKEKEGRKGRREGRRDGRRDRGRPATPLSNHVHGMDFFFAMSQHSGLGSCFFFFFSLLRGKENNKWRDVLQTTKVLSVAFKNKYVLKAFGGDVEKKKMLPLPQLHVQ